MSKKFLTTTEIFAFLEEVDEECLENAEINLVNLPPEDVDELSEEELFDDTEMNVNNLGIQVENMPDPCGPIELDLYNASTSENDKDGGERTDSSLTDGLNFCPIPKWRKRATKLLESINVEHEKMTGIAINHGDKTPFELFCLFCDDDLFKFIATESNRYAQQRNAHHIRFTASDIRKFIGILLYSGWAPIPAYRNYWSLDPLLGRSIIRQVMSRNRFDCIKRFFHVSNNLSLDPTDKFAKLRPFFDRMNKKFMQFEVFTHKLSIDEQMVPYFGRHSCRMFIKNKPVRFGFKLWCLCSSDGYLYKFIPYAGASATDNYIVNRAPKNLGLGGNVVVSLLNDIKPQEHECFFDNFFTSHNLMCYLTSIGCVATGTIRVNRTCKVPETLIADVKTFKKKPRGEYQYSFDINTQLSIVRWNDNSVVSLASNKYSVQPLQRAKRYCRKSKQTKLIDCPHVVSIYNQNMGGVDSHDNAVANYRVNIRGKKWYWPLITTMFDSCVVNAWKLHCAIQKHRGLPQEPQINFKIAICRALLLAEFSEDGAISGMSSDGEAEMQPKKKMCKFQQMRNVPETIRHDNVGHFPEKIACGKRLR